ncbi:patatin-like phospholipase family protein [Novosphingobium acidiphilum]|uniref:patatin-like phospholipase family protein n=1 Tax=Novosphingobium acidiphilum TaxID=505248 RepID=UPI0003FC847F|nr:patatin-like phospholipase family protein [Novosphingobium acidiphilum]
MSARLFLAPVLLGLLAACTQSRPALVGNIAISAKRIPANLNQQGTAAHAAPVPSAVARLVAYARARNQEQNRATCDVLVGHEQAQKARAPHASGPSIVLSGGSEDGAFGAGLFLGLQDKHQLPPEPEVVTGVSTGSLQATFVFLARQPVAGDRTYEWVDRQSPSLRALPGADQEPPLAEKRSNLEDLALAYSISREGDILKPAPLGGISVVTQGTRARLTPLRDRLTRMITEGTIAQVAAQACLGRVLLVGVADVDDGYGYALDMTELALEAFAGGHSTDRMTKVRETYVSALLASSSVPIGAMPVTLRFREFDDDGKPVEVASREHLFIDGGARFGVFLPDTDDDADVTLVVNTSLATNYWHSTDKDPNHPASKWSALTLAERTVEDLLETQVYQLSVGRVEASARSLSMAYISNQNVVYPDGTPGEPPDQHVYAGQTCGWWRDRDKALQNPLQFHPGYMACLLDYGRTRGNLAQWNLRSTRHH